MNPEPLTQPPGLDTEAALLERILSAGGLLHGALDRVAQAVSASLDVPVALVSLVGRERQHFVGQVGMPEWARRGTPLTHSFCRYVALAAEPLVIDEAEQHPLVCDNPAISELGVAAYAGQPITVAGRPLGSLCAIDHVPRAWTEREIRALRSFADLVEYMIESRLQTAGQLRDEQKGARARASQHSAQVARLEFLASEQVHVQALNRRLQHALLPRPALNRQVTTLYEPGSDRLLLGGDFVDIFSAADLTLHFVLGDVVGHGPEAAGLAISLRASWHALVSVGIGLPEIVGVLDAQTVEAGSCATVLVGAISADGQLSLVSAGHPTPIAVGDHGVRELSGRPGPMLGLGIAAPRWPQVSEPLGTDTLVAYTDGLIEGLFDGASRERFGVERLMSSVAELGPDPESLCGVAVEANGGPLPDDVAILVVRPA